MTSVWHPFEKKSMFILSMSTIITAQLILFYVLYLLAFQKPILSNVVSFEPMSKIATPGGTLKFQIMLESPEKHGIHAHRQIICSNGVITLLSPEDLIVPKGNLTLYKEIEIPERLEPGKCRMEVISENHTNFLNTIEKVSTSGEFTVVK